MLVEDDATMQVVLRTLLELEGFQVSVAPDKKEMGEIIQSIRDAQPDIILLDVHLHNASGFEVLQKLRQDSDASVKQTRVIMSSGSDVQDQCLKAGADDFLMKPYMPDELIDKLRK